MASSSMFTLRFSCQNTVLKMNTNAGLLVVKAYSKSLKG